MRETLELIYAQFWVVVHHRWLALAGCILLCIAGWITVSTIPDMYRVKTKVLIDTQTVLKPLLAGLAITNTATQRSATIMRQTLLSTPNMMDVIRSADLDLSIETPLEMDKKIQELQKNISISEFKVGGKRSGSNIYMIAYINQDPKLAKKIVDILLNIFVENILGKSRKESDTAEEFLDLQIKNYEQKLNEAEQKLKIFKQENIGLMPSEGKDYFVRVSSLKEKLEASRLLLKEKETHVFSIRTQLDTFVNADSIEQIEDFIKDTPLGKRINGLQERLDEMLLNYTDKHPDVIATTRILEELQRRSLQELEKDDERNSSVKQITKETRGSGLFQELTVMLTAAEAETASLRARVNNYQGKIVKMNSVINTIPEVEAEFTKLNRDYGNLKNTYQKLVQRSTAASLSREADQSGSDFQFNIIEPPVIPRIPVSPNRVFLISVVFIFSLFGGTGVALLAEQLRPTFYNRKQIEDKFDVPVLGAVSMYWSKEQLASKRKDIIIYGVFSLIPIVLYSILLMNYVLGIDFLKYLPILG